MLLFYRMMNHMLYFYCLWSAMIPIFYGECNKMNRENAIINSLLQSRDCHGCVAQMNGGFCTLSSFTKCVKCDNKKSKWTNIKINKQKRMKKDKRNFSERWPQGKTHVSNKMRNTRVCFCFDFRLRTRWLGKMQIKFRDRFRGHWKIQ